MLNMETLKEKLEKATAGWAFFDTVETDIGRAAVPNILDKFIGLTDKKGTRVYFRFDGGPDYSLDTVKLSARAVSFDVAVKLKAIIATKCANIEEIAFATADQLCGHPPTGQLWDAQGISTDAGAIFEEETGQPLKNNAVRIASINLTLTWMHQAGCGLESLVCRKCK
jgi:hypothetical protein